MPQIHLPQSSRFSISIGARSVSCTLDQIVIFLGVLGFPYGPALDSMSEGHAITIPEMKILLLNPPPLNPDEFTDHPLDSESEKTP